MHGDRPEGRTADAKDDKAFAVVPDPLRRLVYCRQVLALRAVQLSPAQTVTLGIDALKRRTHFLRHCGELLRLNAVFTHGRGEHVVVIDMNLHVLFLIIHEKRTPPHDIVQLYHITLSRSNAMTILDNILTKRSPGIVQDSCRNILLCRSAKTPPITKEGLRKQSLQYEYLFGCISPEATACSCRQGCENAGA